jgi:hypothetical protein
VTVRLDPDFLQRCRRAEGLSVAQIGELSGLSRATVYGWLHRYGITTSGPVVDTTELVAAWRAGTPLARLAARTGVAPRALRERLVAATALRPPRRYLVVGSPEDPLRPDLLRRWHGRRGLTAEEVAVLTDLTARQVRYRLRRYRLSRARPGPPARLGRRLPEGVLRRWYIEEQLSCPQIAARVGASAERVRELLIAAGITRRPSGLAGAGGRPPLDAARLRVMYAEEGRTLAEIARELGYLTAAGNPAVRRVRSALARAGLPSRRGANWSARLDPAGPEDDVTLRRLYEVDGLTVAQVARRLGWLTPSDNPATTYTRSRLLAAGVMLRKPGPRR